MRVTANLYSQNLVAQLQKLESRQATLQNQISTGQRIQMPEDDPAAMRRVLAAHTESKALAQYRQNIATLQDQAKAAFQSMKDLKTISDRAGEIATSVGSPQSSEDLKTLGHEVTQLIRRTVDLANTKHQGDYLFGGTQTSQAPYSITEDANGNITGVVYHGNQTVAEAEIGENNQLGVTVPGANSTGTGARGLLADSRTGADFLQHLVDLQNHLLSGDTTAITNTDRANLGKDEDNLIYHLGSNGFLQSRLEVADASASQRKLSLSESISRDADANMSETIVRFNQTQTAYQAAMQAGANLMNQSLLDYLR